MCFYNTFIVLTKYLDSYLWDLLAHSPFPTELSDCSVFVVMYCDYSDKTYFKYKMYIYTRI